VKPSYRRWLIRSVATGLGVAIILLVAGKAAVCSNLVMPVGYYVFWLKLVMWPSSLWLMATEGAEGTAWAYLLLLISMCANGLLYGLVGSVLWWLKHMVVRVRQDH
jgi:hypothetical protein